MAHVPAFPETIKRLSSGGVITNYHCVSRCGHCLYNCGPHREKTYLDPAQAGAIFERILSLGCHTVHIGGGEPLLHPQKLIKILEAARDCGMAVDYVETSSAWYVSPGQADDVLSQLQAAGLGTLLVSISPFHNAHIPYARVNGVIEACRRTGMGVFPWVNGFVRDLTRLDMTRTHSMADFQAAFGNDYLDRIPDRYWIHTGGRVLDTFSGVFPKLPLHRVLETSPENCAGALSDTSHFHIDLYGNYIPGLCSGLAIQMDDLGRRPLGRRPLGRRPLGRRPLGRRTVAEYPLLNRLAAQGVRGLFNFAHQTYSYAPRKDGFINHCDLCTDIRTFLVQSAAHPFHELAPESFYAEWIAASI